MTIKKRRSKPQTTPITKAMIFDTFRRSGKLKDTSDEPTGDVVDTLGCVEFNVFMIVGSTDGLNVRITGGTSGDKKVGIRVGIIEGNGDDDVVGIGLGSEFG